MDPPSSSLQSNISAADHNENPIPAVDNNIKKIKGKIKVFKDAASVASSSSSSASTSSGFSVRGATRVASKRRGPKVVVNAARRNPTSDEIGFRIGMSMAVFVNQILERNGELCGGKSPDHLAKICALAVKESLANDFGNTFDYFIHNFEQSFGSTLRTLKSIKEASEDNKGYLPRKQNMEECSSRVSHDEQDDCLRREGCKSSSRTEDSHSKEVTLTAATEVQLDYRDQLHQNVPTNPVSLEVSLHDQTNQLTCIRPRTFEPATNQSLFEKSVVEQTRANELKIVELGLAMKKLSLKEEQVALGYDSNYLERSKIAMGRSKASFKAEKFKTQLEDTRHSELLRTCIDCLVAGLFIMVAAGSYGTYLYSYGRIMEATASCTPSKDSKSWWNPMSSFNSVFQVLRCQAEVLSRMVFGFFMIFAIAYLILQRSAGSKQTMPVTFIILLLGFACGWAGKFCVDTLGGSGKDWLIYWETLCAMHFFCNVCTSVLYHILHGPVDVSLGTKGSSIWNYRIRRLVFYSIMLFFLPVSCGLLPFASLGEWKHHFVLLVTDIFVTMTP